MALSAKMIEHLEQHIKWPATKKELMTTCNMHRDDASFPADEREKMIKLIDSLANDLHRRYTLAEFRQMLAA